MSGDRFLSFNERRELTRLVQEISIFKDGGSYNRRVFLEESAGLGEAIKGIDLSQRAETVVPALVGKLEEYGELRSRPGYHALGALLVEVLDLGELPPKNNTVIASAIVQYSLVADPDYVQRLRSDYQVVQAAARPFQAMLFGSIPPAVKTVASDIPFQASVTDEAVLEQVINSEDNFLDINFLYGAIYCAQAVCLIEIPQDEPVGTGFLVNHQYLLTNQHVIKNEHYLEGAIARFEYLKDASDVRSGGQVIKILPDFYRSSPQTDLDYALVHLERSPLAELSAEPPVTGATIKDYVIAKKHRGYLSLADRMIKEKDRVNIIQHPEGGAMKVVMTQNYVVADMSAKRVQYVADTKGGSSGSPVFNSKWELVALHHSGGPYPPESVTDTIKKGWKGHFRVNEGIPMRAILKDLHDQGLDQYLGK